MSWEQAIEQIKRRYEAAAEAALIERANREIQHIRDAMRTPEHRAAVAAARAEQAKRKARA